MVADANDLTMIRFAIADTSGVGSEAFNDDTLQLFWSDAEVLYPSGDVFVLREQTIITALGALFADSAKLVTYKQNSQSENMSDVFKHLKALKDYHVGELASLEKRGKQSVRFAVTKKVPTRLKEYPDDYI